MAEQETRGRERPYIYHYPGWPRVRLPYGGHQIRWWRVWRKPYRLLAIRFDALPKEKKWLN